MFLEAWGGPGPPTHLPSNTYWSCLIHTLHFLKKQNKKQVDYVEKQ